MVYLLHAVPTVAIIAALVCGFILDMKPLAKILMYVAAGTGFVSFFISARYVAKKNFGQPELANKVEPADASLSSQNELDQVAQSQDKPT